MLIDSNLSDDTKKHLKEIAVPVLVAGLSTLLQEFAKLAAHEVKERLKRRHKEIDKSKE